MVFWWSKRVLGLKMAENGRKMAKKPFWTKKNFGHFWTILDLFGTKNRFFSPKKPIFVQNKYFEQKKIWMKNFDFLLF